MRLPFKYSRRFRGANTRFDEEDTPERPRPHAALRALLVVLLIANLGYFAWTRGGLAVLGTMPARLTESDPRRLAQQLRPQVLKIIKDESAAVNP